MGLAPKAFGASTHRPEACYVAQRRRASGLRVRAASRRSNHGATLFSNHALSSSIVQDDRAVICPDADCDDCPVTVRGHSVQATHSARSGEDGPTLTIPMFSDRPGSRASPHGPDVIGSGSGDSFQETVATCSWI